MGNYARVTVIPNIGRFGYTGQTWLGETGLWYYKARMYSARLGRFMQTDPIGYADGMNLYAYVRNDPLNLVDPTGTNGTINNFDAIIVTAVQEVFVPSPSAGFAPGGGLGGEQSEGGGSGETSPQNDDIVVTARCRGICVNQNSIQALANRWFVCAGGNVVLAGGICYSGGQGYLYSGVAFPPGGDLTVGYAPGGAAGYLNGASVGGNGLPGAGIGFTNGTPSANAWTVGTPGVSATYGMSFGDIGARFGDMFSTMSNGFYNMMGRPYGPYDY